MIASKRLTHLVEATRKKKAQLVNNAKLTPKKCYHARFRVRGMEWFVLSFRKLHLSLTKFLTNHVVTHPKLFSFQKEEIFFSFEKKKKKRRRRLFFYLFGKF